MSRTIAGTPFTVCYMTEVFMVIMSTRKCGVLQSKKCLNLLRMIEKKQKNTINTLLVCAKKLSLLDIYQEKFQVIFWFHQSRSREQNKSIDNWKTTTGNWTCRSDKVNFHNNKRFSYVLENELVKRKNKFRTLTLKLKKKGAYRKFLFYLIK